MKLLLINSIGRSKWGGGEKWMLMAAGHLIERGHQVCISCRPGSILEERAKAQQIPVLPVNISTDFSLSALLKLRKYIFDKQFDVIIGCQNRDVRLAGLIVKKWLKINTVVLSRQGVQLLHRSIKYKLNFVPLCDGIITNTVSIKQEYDSYGWWDSDFVKVIYNGIEINEQGQDVFNYQRYIKSGTKPFIILSTGRLSNQKGFRYLIEAAKEVVEQNSDVFFFIAGKGKLEKELKAQIKREGLGENVFLIGFHDNVGPLLKGADLFVLPSLYEGMPNSVMEAMAFGVPVISTDVNGVSELMKHGKHGFIIPPADSAALAKNILAMIEPGDHRMIGQEGQKHVSKNFSVDRMIDQLEAYLSEKIKKQHSGA